MRLYITCDTQKEQLPEYLLIELQGSIEANEDEFNELVLGEIRKGLQDVNIQAEIY